MMSFNLQFMPQSRRQMQILMIGKSCIQTISFYFLKNQEPISVLCGYLHRLRKLGNCIQFLPKELSSNTTDIDS